MAYSVVLSEIQILLIDSVIQLIDMEPSGISSLGTPNNLPNNPRDAGGFCSQNPLSSIWKLHGVASSSVKNPGVDNYHSNDSHEGDNEQGADNLDFHIAREFTADAPRRDPPVFPETHPARTEPSSNVRGVQVPSGKNSFLRSDNNQDPIISPQKPTKNGVPTNPITELADGLRLVEVRIDKHVVRGNATVLECRFDLQGETLYSVKWYKDGHEFYRFVPQDSPPAQLFPLPGVHVRLDRSNETQVALGALDLSSTGRYRCEVSAEAPSFQTVSDHGDMQVVALPEEGPRIYGGKPRYQAGDLVQVNCSSGRSKPAAALAWYINGEQAISSYLRGPYMKVEGREGLVKTTLGLEFRVERRHFRRGDLKLRCIASIAAVYYNSNEESVEGDRLQRPPALEVKDNSPHSSSQSLSQEGRSTRSWFVFGSFLLSKLLAAALR